MTEEDYWEAIDQELTKLGVDELSYWSEMRVCWQAEMTPNEAAIFISSFICFDLVSNVALNKNGKHITLLI